MLLFAGCSACSHALLSRFLVPGDAGLEVGILLTMLTSGLFSISKMIDGDFKNPVDGLIYAMEAVGGSLFLCLLTGLWLKGGITRWKDEGRAAGKAFEKCLVGIPWGR